MADQTAKSSYNLYCNRFSVCSLMVRYCLAIRGTAQDANAIMIVDELEVDIFATEQLNEAFLCDINPKGQVPVLTHQTALPQPIQDSLEITLYIAERYPKLIPHSHKDEIIQLLRDLHSINYFSLTFSGEPEVAYTILRDPILQILKRPNISKRYRNALQYKLMIVEKNKIGGIEPNEVDEAVQQAQSILSKLGSLFIEGQGPWLHGHSATALDAHVVIFLSRLQDVGRANLISSRLRRYLAMAMETWEWQAIMAGNRTMRDVR